MRSRRDFIRSALLGAGALAASPAGQAQQQASVIMEADDHSHAHLPHPQSKSGAPLLVQTPDIPNLGFQWDNGVKVFRLVAEPVRRELIPGRVMDVWGYNGTCPGPNIQVTQGDRVRIILKNHLPEPTTMHWHGFEIPVQMDGMPYISQKPIPPGGQFIYEFTLHQQGTFFYHSHGAMQEMMGMVGMFIMHPASAHQPRVDRDFGIVLQGWAILPNNTVPNTAGMEFNWLTFNGKAGPASTPLLVRHGDRVRIRIVNLSMDHHPIHLHGHTFAITGTEGGRQPQGLWSPSNTVLVGVAQARDIEFVANNPGDWMLHCHLPHHMMNNMSDLMTDRMLTTSALSPAQAREQMRQMRMPGAHGAHGPHAAEPAVAANASVVPGFPQDAFMEMPMDEAVAKPENHGLPPNWSAGMMGMMTLLRVLPPEKFERIQEMKAQPGVTHQHHHNE